MLGTLFPQATAQFLWIQLSTILIVQDGKMESVDLVPDSVGQMEHNVFLMTQCALKLILAMETVSLAILDIF